MKGLFIRGTPIFGNVTNSSSADLSDIDMTAERTDPRLIFECLSPRAVIARDGSIQYAPANEWLVEYKDGVAIGRHEPEPQDTNLLIWSSSFNAWTKGGITVTQNAAPDISGGNTAQMLTASATSYSRVFVSPRLSAGNNTLTLIVRAGSTPYLHGTFEDIGTTNTMRFYANMTTLETSVVVVRGIISGEMTARKFVGGWVMLTLHAVLPADSGYYVFFGPSNILGGVSAMVGDTIYAAFTQLEHGPVATSLIATNGAAATRAAAFAWVKNPGLMATAARIYYTDGTTHDIALNGAERGAIPQASKDWATRYIEGISYAKGFSR
ncbi:TPA: hypothetical protein J8I72_004586 [Escherichia coli]|nr:hypothetical protein [Escherichia coli]HAZ7433018.1 hypothetical protein [Escherichia coli]